MAGRACGRWEAHLLWGLYRLAWVELPFLARHCSMHFLYINSLIFIATARRWPSFFFNFDFTYEKPEAQKSMVILPGHTAS